MTIVIALCCSDGVVMASDSQVTETDAGIRYPSPKIFQLTDRAVWGGSGDGQTITDISTALGGATDQIAGSSDLPQDLARVIKPVLERRYANVVALPGEEPPRVGTASLACGYEPDRGGWIVEVDATCISTHYGDRGFHAIGSAAGFALLGNALLAHFRPSERPLTHGQLIAYRVIHAAIETSMFGVGGDIQMWCADEEGARHLGRDDLQVMSSLVGAWQEDERSSLDRIAGVPLLEPAAPPSPLPPVTGDPPGLDGS